MISRAVSHPDADSDFLIWKLAWRYKVLLVVMILIGTAIGFLYTTQAKRVYESSAQVLINRRNVAFPSEGSLGRVDYEARLADNVLATQMMVLRSPLIVEQAVEADQLEKLKSFADAGSPVSQIIGGLEIVRGTKAAREADVLTVQYQGYDSHDCQTVLESVLDSYRQFLGETEKGFNDQTIRLMTRAKEELHEQLSQKEAAYLAFRKEAPLQWDNESKEAESIHAARLNRLEEERARIQRRRTEIATHIKSIEEAMDQGADKRALLLLIGRMADGSGGSNPPRSLDLETQLFTLQTQEQLLLRDFGPEHPLVKAVQEKITAWQNYIDAGEGLRGRTVLPDNMSEDFLPLYLDSREREIAEMDCLEKELSDTYLQEQKAAQEAMVYVLQDRNYQNDLDRTQRLFEQALQSLQTLTLLRDHGGYSMKVIWPPGLGDQVEPRVPLIMTIAGLVAVCVGFGIAYIRYVNDNGFHSPQEIQDHLGIPVLSHIPRISRRPAALLREADHRNGQATPTLFAIARPGSPEAEACHTIRTELCLRNRRDGQKVFQITSPESGAGTTTLATNLSALLALPDRRVLLIDANFRRPAVHHLLDVDHQLRLADVLVEGRDWDANADSSQLARMGNVWVLPSGSVLSNPAELLTCSAFENLINTARKQFDFVIIDSPALGSLTDACAIAQHVDGVLLVMRINKASRLQMQAALESLLRTGANLIGAVINDVGGFRTTGNGSQPASLNEAQTPSLLKR